MPLILSRVPAIMYSSCCCEQPERVVYHSIVEMLDLIWQLKVIITIGKKYRSGVGHLQWRRNLFTSLVEFSRRGIIATSSHWHCWIQTSGSFKSLLLAADAECVQTDVHTTDCWQKQSMLVTYHPLYMCTYEPCEAEASYSIPALLFRHLLLLA